MEDKKSLERTKDIFDFLFEKLFEDREITQKDRDDHCEGDTDD